MFVVVKKLNEIGIPSYRFLRVIGGCEVQGAGGAKLEHCPSIGNPGRCRYAGQYLNRREDCFVELNFTTETDLVARLKAFGESEVYVAMSVGDATKASVA